MSQRHSQHLNKPAAVCLQHTWIHFGLLILLPKASYAPFAGVLVVLTTQCPHKCKRFIHTWGICFKVIPFFLSIWHSTALWKMWLTSHNTLCGNSAQTAFAFNKEKLLRDDESSNLQEFGYIILLITFKQISISRVNLSRGFMWQSRGFPRWLLTAVACLFCYEILQQTEKTPYMQYHPDIFTKYPHNE